MEKRIILDPRSISRSQAELEARFHRYVIGQDRAVRRLARSILHANSMEGRLRDETKPAGAFFYLGPTGVGKTRLVEVFAKLLFGSFDAMLKVDCSELKNSHELSRLIGAPPGYIGHDRPPLLTQRRLDHWGFITDPDASVNPKVKKELNRLLSQIGTLDKEMYETVDKIMEMDKSGAKTVKRSKKHLGLNNKAEDILVESMVLKEKYNQLIRSTGYQPGTYPSILLFDEIERAHPDLFDLLLQVHDKGKLTTHEEREDGNNEVWFHNTFIFYTSNIAERELSKLLGNSTIGFASATVPDDKLDTAIYRTALAQLKKKFSPAFLGRLGNQKIVVFSNLRREDVQQSLDTIIIPGFIDRFTNSFPVSIIITDGVKDYLVDEAFNARNKALGMRALEAVFVKDIEENLVTLTQKTKEEGGIVVADKVLIDIKDDELVFSVEQRSDARKKGMRMIKLVDKKLKREHKYDPRVKSKTIVTFRIREP